MPSVLAVILNFFCKEIDGIRSKKQKVISHHFLLIDTILLFNGIRTK